MFDQTTSKQCNTFQSFVSLVSDENSLLHTSRNIASKAKFQQLQVSGRRKTRDGVTSREDWVSLQTCVDQFAGGFGYMPLVDSLFRFKHLLLLLTLEVLIFFFLQAGPSAIQRPSVKSQKEIQGA